MTNVTCSVYSCAHHKDCFCCKPNIKISGEKAQSCDETCCSSYAPKGDENAVAFMTPNAALEISCSAYDCVYNKEHRCTAKNVCINGIGHNVNCSTFTKII